MKLNIAKVETSITTITLTGDDILDLLKSKYPEHLRGSKRVDVEFKVPGGGDWSNCNVDVASDSPVVITVVR